MITIRKYIQDFIAPDFGENDPLPFPARELRLKKNDVITAHGQIESKAYFLCTGIVEVNMDSHGGEKILEFFSSSQFFCSYTSFLTQQPSDVEVKCVTDCVLEVITRDDLLDAYRHSLIANQLGRYATEQIFLMRTKREKEFLTTSAEERYLNLMKERAGLFTQLPLHKIAKYLGVHPESLSRIRKQIS